MKGKNKNTLKRVRLKAGLTQQDVAYLLGLKSHQTISRIEHRKWMPSIGILIAYSIIFSTDFRSLIPDIATKQTNSITHRAKELHENLKTSKAQNTHQRLKALENLIKAKSVTY